MVKSSDAEAIFSYFVSATPWLSTRLYSPSSWATAASTPVPSPIFLTALLISVLRVLPKSSEGEKLSAAW
jgi:hypothetical protein